MAWHELEVSGHPTRSAVEQCSRDPRAHVELQFDDDVLPPHTQFMYGMWFLTLSITGIDTTTDTVQIDNPDDPLTSVSFTGTITGTNIPVQIIFFGQVLDRFMVDLG